MEGTSGEALMVLGEEPHRHESPPLTAGEGPDARAMERGRNVDGTWKEHLMKCSEERKLSREAVAEGWEFSREAIRQASAS